MDAFDGNNGVDADRSDEHTQEVGSVSITQAVEALKESAAKAALAELKLKGNALAEALQSAKADYDAALSEIKAWLNDSGDSLTIENVNANVIDIGGGYTKCAGVTTVVVSSNGKVSNVKGEYIGSVPFFGGYV